MYFLTTKETDIPQYISVYTHGVTLLNSSLNALVFMMCNRDFKSFTKSFLGAFGVSFFTAKMRMLLFIMGSLSLGMHAGRGGVSFEKVGWIRRKIYCQKVYLMIFISFLLWNKYCPEKSGVDMSTPVHPVAPPLRAAAAAASSRPSRLKAPCLSWKGNRAPLLAVFRRNSKVRIRQRRTKVRIHYILVAN